MFSPSGVKESWSHHKEQTRSSKAVILGEQTNFLQSNSSAILTTPEFLFRGYKK